MWVFKKNNWFFIFYSGDLKSFLINLGPEAVTLKKGTKVSQLIIERHNPCEMKLLKDWTKKTSRGEKGFGSSDRIHNTNFQKDGKSEKFRWDQVGGVGFKRIYWVYIDVLITTSRPYLIHKCLFTYYYYL